MNWAAWEYMVACNKRKDRWRAAVGDRVKGSRRMIYDTRPNAVFVRSRPGYQWSEFKGNPYGGSITGRMTAGSLIADMAKVHQAINHQLDAMIYGAMLHGMAKHKRGPCVWVHDEIWLDDFDGEIRSRFQRKKIKFEFYERTLRWQSNLIDLDRSSSVTLLHEPDTSRSDGNKSKRGWLSKTRRRSTAWLPTPRTKLIQSQPKLASQA